MAQAGRIIKKYANRRLYDTETSQTITLADVRDLIGAGESIQVVEARTGNDVTRQVLLQIMADQELLGRPVLSNDFLEAMIRVSSNPMRDMTREYLERIMTHVQSQQQFFDQAFGSAFGKAGLDGFGRAAVEPWRKFQERMFSLWSEAIKPPLGDFDSDSNTDRNSDRNFDPDNEPR